MIQRAKEYGYQEVEIDGKRPHGNPRGPSREACRRLRRLAGDQGIEIDAVAAGSDLSSAIPEHRECQLVYLRELIKMTAELSARTPRVLLAWPGVTLRPEGGARYDIAQAVWREAHREFSEEQTWEWCRQGMIEAARFAGEHGVTLALENHAPVITGYRDCMRMIRALGSPHLKMCFDARLERKLDAAAIEKALIEVGPLHVLSHFGGEYDKGDDGVIRVTGGEPCPAAESMKAVSAEARRRLRQTT